MNYIIDKITISFNQLTARHIMTVISVLVIVVLLMPSTSLIVLVWALLGCFAIINPAYGVAGWIIFLPFESYFTQIIAFSPFIIATPILLFSVYLHGLISLKLDFAILGLIFSSTFIMFAMVSFVFNPLTGNLRNISSLLLLLLTFLAISWSIYTYKDAFEIIKKSINIAFLLSIFISFVLSGSGSNWRIGIAGSVRMLSNLLGLTLITLFSTILFNQKRKNSFKQQAPYLLLMILAGMTLFMTVSRGVLLSVLLSVVSLTICYVYWNRGCLNKKNIFLSLASTAIITVLGFTFVDSYFTNGQLARRFFGSFLNNTRFSIWISTLQQLSPVELIFGTGPGSFRSTALLAGFDFYAHSIYMDTWVTMGLLGLLALLLFIAFVCWNLVKKKSALGLGLLVYTLISFATHGSLSNKFFWLNLSLVYGLASLQGNEGQTDEGVENEAHSNCNVKLPI